MELVCAALQSRCIVHVCIPIKSPKGDLSFGAISFSFSTLHRWYCFKCAAKPKLQNLVLSLVDFRICEGQRHGDTIVITGTQMLWHPSRCDCSCPSKYKVKNKSRIYLDSTFHREDSQAMIEGARLVRALASSQQKDR